MSCSSGFTSEELELIRRAVCSELAHCNMLYRSLGGGFVALEFQADAAKYADLLLRVQSYEEAQKDE